MKTKQYLLTEVEMLAIRNALMEESVRLKSVYPKSPIFQAIKSATHALAEQFETDCKTIRSTD